MWKINCVKTPLFPNLECLKLSFEGLNTQLEHLKTNDLSLNPLGCWGLRIEDKDLRDCQHPFEWYCEKSFIMIKVLILFTIPGHYPVNKSWE